MIRTQIYLSKSQLDVAKDISRRHKMTLSQFIRQGLELQLQKQPPKAGKKRAYKTFAESLQAVKKLKVEGSKDLSTRVDYYLYV